MLKFALFTVALALSTPLQAQTTLADLGTSVAELKKIQQNAYKQTAKQTLISLRKGSSVPLQDIDTLRWNLSKANLKLADVGSNAAEIESFRKAGHTMKAKSHLASLRKGSSMPLIETMMLQNHMKELGFTFDESGAAKHTTKR